MVAHGEIRPTDVIRAGLSLLSERAHAIRGQNQEAAPWKERRQLLGVQPGVAVEPLHRLDETDQQDHEQRGLNRHLPADEEPGGDDR